MVARATAEPGNEHEKSAGTAYRIRTDDLRLERAVSWASRRMRHGRRRGARRSGANGTTAGRPARTTGPGGMNAARRRGLRRRELRRRASAAGGCAAGRPPPGVRASLQVLPGHLVGRSWRRAARRTGPSRPPPQSTRNSGHCETPKRRCPGSMDPRHVLRPMLMLVRAASPRWRTLQVIQRPAGRGWARGPAVPPRHQWRETLGARETPKRGKTSSASTAGAAGAASSTAEATGPDHRHGRSHGRSHQRGPPARTTGPGGMNAARRRGSAARSPPPRCAAGGCAAGGCAAGAAYRRAARAGRAS